MPYRKKDIEPMSKQLTIAIGLTVVGFMAFGLALSFYRNVLFEETLQDIAEQNKEISKSIDKSYRDLAYYQSAQFKDKYAKENLNKQNPGEKVIILTKPPTIAGDSIVDETLDRERREAAYEELLLQMPVWEHWQLFIFHPEKIEELKKGL